MTPRMASHLLPCPVVFISTAHENQRDIMVATTMFVSEKEPLLAVSLAKGHRTLKLIEKSGEFTLIAVSKGQTDLYKQLLGLSGKEPDKFAALSIATLPARPSKALIPKGSAAWFDCKPIAKQEIAGYVVIIARITDHKDLGKLPLIWRTDRLYSLKPV